MFEQMKGLSPKKKIELWSCHSSYFDYDNCCDFFCRGQDKGKGRGIYYGYYVGLRTCNQIINMIKVSIDD